MVEVTDYCDMNSGKEIDKSELFEVFYGDLKTAPMIKEAPVNMECKVVRTIDTEKGHHIFIGDIVNAYAEEKYLTNGIPDVTKFHPIIFSMGYNYYWKFGELIGRAWSIGRNFKKI